MKHRKQRFPVKPCQHKKCFMNRIASLLLATITIFGAIACKKGSSGTTTDLPSAGLYGKWILKGSDGTGPGNTLQFYKKNDSNFLSFDCSGSPGPDWPSHAETAYKIEDGKLMYMNYAEPAYGFYTATSFQWIVLGQEFEIKRRQLLLYMSADYTVRYVKVI
jgi:hypothetical protein